MDVQVRHTPSFAVVRCTMSGGEAVRAESGAMMATSLRTIRAVGRASVSGIEYASESNLAARALPASVLSESSAAN